MVTERDLFEMLRAKLAKPGNGGAGEFALLAQVRDDAGFNARRTFDAMSVSLWPSRGHTIHVYEMKISRSDWQRELAKPEKADDACRIADQFSIVAPAGIVRDGELPPTWGLIEERDGKLRTSRAAPFLHGASAHRPTISRGLLVAMLRAAPGAIPGGKNPSASEREIRQAHDAGFKEGAAYERTLKRPTTEQRQYEDWQAFEKALTDAGLPTWEAHGSSLVPHAAMIAAAVLGGQAERRIANLREELLRIVALLDPS